MSVGVGQQSKKAGTFYRCIELTLIERFCTCDASWNDSTVFTNKILQQKSGVDGKLFGSVTNANIAEALKEQGYDIDKSMVRMPDGQLKQVGDYTLTIALHSDISAHITVSVLGEATT